MRPRRWIGASAVIALALTLITIRSLDAPLFLYPSSASLPAGLYMRSFENVGPGTIVGFVAPEAAKLYQAKLGAEMTHDYLIMKSVIAGPGDHICNDTSDGLRINGNWIAPTADRDTAGQPLPIWSDCRHLADSEFFMYSAFATNSFDSRYFGPVKISSILGRYKRWL